MSYNGVFSEIDRERAERTFRKLLGHDIAGWALTGGFAIEAHLERCGVPVRMGPGPRAGAIGTIQSVYIDDPDQNSIEISSY